MSVRIVTEVRGLDRAGRVLGNLSHLDMTDLLDNLGQLIENQVKFRISEQEGPPEGGDWAEYSEKYGNWKEWKGKGGAGFLRLEGHLLESIQHVVFGDQVEIGSNLSQAAKHQLGSKDGNTPARPYLGLNEENEDDVEDLVNKWLEQQAAA